MCTMGYREADAAHPLPAPPHHTYEEMTDLPLSLSLSHTHRHKHSSAVPECVSVSSRTACQTSHR